MNRIALFGVATVVSGSLMIASPATAKNNRPVLSGAMDICKIIDEGDVTVSNGEETCCAQEKLSEGDDGVAMLGDEYCVTCAQGTDVCYITEGTTRSYSPVDIKKLLKTVKQKQAPVTGN